ncbi:MAG: cytochrome c biogenesis CcdA family protein [Fusobacteriaceae bacterium]
MSGLLQVDINFALTILAGLATFLSPCIIPIIPGYLSYISNKKFIFVHTLFFIFGFGIAFTILQILFFYFANFFSKIFGTKIINITFGIFIIFLGLEILGIFKLKLFEREKKFNFDSLNKNFFTSIIFGFAFGFGWTPCMGPILFGILSYLSSTKTLSQGIFYLWGFVFGLGIPFLIFSLILTFSSKLKLPKINYPAIKKIAGIILIIIGILLATDNLDIFL